MPVCRASRTPRLRLWCLPFLPPLLWLLTQPFTTNTQLFYTINHAGLQWSDATLAVFVFVGSGWGILSLTFPLLIFAPRVLITAAGAGLTAGIFARVLKVTLDVPRPAAVLPPESFRVVGDALHSLSMPSGHTLTVFAIATTLYASLSRTQRLWGLWLYVIAILSGLARIAVGAHWPADVLAGATIGLFFGLLATTVLAPIPDTLFTHQSWLVRLAATAGLVCGYVLATNALEIDLIKPLQTLGILVIAATLSHFLPLTLRRPAFTETERAPSPDRPTEQ